VAHRLEFSVSSQSLEILRFAQTPGPDDAAVVKKWGAAPSFIPGMDVYPALQRGTLTGGIGSVMLQVDLKRYEVAP